MTYETVSAWVTLIGAGVIAPAIAIIAIAPLARAGKSAGPVRMRGGWRP